MNPPLKQIKEQLQESLEQFVWNVKPIIENGGRAVSYELNNLTQARLFINNIHKMGLFNVITDFLMKTKIYLSSDENLELHSKDDIKSFYSNLRNLRSLCKEFLNNRWITFCNLQ